MCFYSSFRKTGRVPMRRHDFTFRLNPALIQSLPLALLDPIKEVCLYPELENTLVHVVACVGFYP